MIGALAGEWTKLYTTRAPWWTAALAVVAMGGLGLVRALTSSDDLTPSTLLDGASLGLLIIMVLASLAATSDHTTGTHRLALMAYAGRIRLFTAKALVTAIVCAAVAALGAGILTATTFGLANVSDNWASGDVRGVWGQVLTWSISGVIAVSVGTIIRRSALAAPLVVVWPMAVEPLIAVIPSVGKDISAWLPFINAIAFTNPAQVAEQAGGHGPGVALAVFTAYAVGLAVLAALIESRRDA